MLAGLGHLVKTFLCHILDHDILFLCFPADGHHRSILAAVQNKYLIDRLATAKCFYDRISAFYRKFFVSHLFLISTRFPGHLILPSDFFSDQRKPLLYKKKQSVCLFRQI